MFQYLKLKWANFKRFFVKDSSLWEMLEESQNTTDSLLNQRAALEEALGNAHVAKEQVNQNGLFLVGLLLLRAGGEVRINRDMIEMLGGAAYEINRKDEDDGAVSYSIDLQPIINEVEDCE